MQLLKNITIDGSRIKVKQVLWYGSEGFKWERTKEEAATEATILHAAIEAYYNGNEIECMIQRGRRVVAFPSFSKKHLNSLHIGQR